MEDKEKIRAQMLAEVRMDSGVYHDTMTLLIDAIESKDRYMKGHSQRVKRYAQMIAHELKLPDEEKSVLSIAALLHDIGNIKVDDAIWHKQGKLTKEEYESAKRHSIEGAEMLASITYLESAAQLIKYHHENFDGQGYPAGLKGEDIPLGSRIIAVAEVFDALTSDRSYRKRLDPEVALDEIEGLAGSQFDPQVVNAFVSVWRRMY